MGRTKRFDEQRVLEQAMQLFWQHGYDGTTYSLLEHRTGISGRSLINAYGDKDELFLRALDCYHLRQAVAYDQIVSSAGIDGIKRFFGDFIAIRADDPRLFGCLMVNTATATSSQGSGVRERVQLFREMFHGRFKQALARDSIPDASRKAEFLVGVLWGIGVELKVGGDSTTLKAIVSYVRRTVDSWKLPPRAKPG